MAQLLLIVALMSVGGVTGGVGLWYFQQQTIEACNAHWTQEIRIFREAKDSARGAEGASSRVEKTEPRVDATSGDLGVADVPAPTAVRRR